MNTPQRKEGRTFQIDRFSGPVDPIAWGSAENGVYISWLRKATEEEIEKVKELKNLSIGGYEPQFDHSRETVSYGCQTFTSTQIYHLIDVFEELSVEKLKKIYEKI